MNEVDALDTVYSKVTFASQRHDFWFLAGMVLLFLVEVPLPGGNSNNIRANLYLLIRLRM